MDNRYAWNCVHWAMCYNRWQCPLGYILQQMTVSTGLCTTTDDSVHWAMCYNRWLCLLGYVLQQTTVSTGLCAKNRLLCPLDFLQLQMTVFTCDCSPDTILSGWLGSKCQQTNLRLCPLVGLYATLAVLHVFWAPNRTVCPGDQTLIGYSVLKVQKTVGHQTCREQSLLF